jgi:hypothetical protein
VENTSVANLLKLVVFALGLVIILIGVTQSGLAAWIAYGFAVLLFILLWIGGNGLYWW